MAALCNHGKIRSLEEQIATSCFCGRAGVRLLRAAVLAAVARERPGEAEPLALARSHFGCTREAAADLLHSAQVRTAGNATSGVLSDRAASSALSYTLACRPWHPHAAALAITQML